MPAMAAILKGLFRLSSFAFVLIEYTTWNHRSIFEFLHHDVQERVHLALSRSVLGQGPESKTIPIGGGYDQHRRPD